MNTIAIGVVTEVTDKVKFIIKATISGEIENVIAFPLNAMDQPEIDEEVLLYRLETIFGYSYLWSKLKLNDATRLKVLGSVIDITEYGITIKSDKDEDSDDPSSFIQISNDGKINVVTNDFVNIQTTNSISLETKDTSINSSDSIEVNSSDTKFSKVGGKVTIDGTVTPNTTGAFCSIPICPFTGATHLGKTVTIS